MAEATRRVPPTTVDQEIEIYEEEVLDSGNSLLDSLRRVLMAGIGAVALAQEEIEEFVNKLVERGEIADKDGRKLVSEVMERRRKTVQESTKKASDELDKRVENVLHRLNVPTSSEINRLSAQISELSAKVDELKELNKR